QRHPGGQAHPRERPDRLRGRRPRLRDDRDLARQGAPGGTVGVVDFDLVDKVVCGGLAAAGFGVLFNVGLRALPWCGASGALALLVRTLALRAGWDLEAASLAASLALSSAVQLAHIRAGISRNALAVSGCIPMVPGSFAAKAILAMFALMSTAA